MFRTFALIVLLFGVIGSALAQKQVESDIRTFEITPVAPPKPALKYPLLFDDLADSRAGNAAILYLESVLLMGSDARDKVEKALEAYYDKKDMAAFATLADELDMPSVIQELELAARCTECDWQPPFREMGTYTLLPHLEPLARGIGRMLQVRALRYADQGKAAEALATLRLGYELAEDIGREPVVVSGLVSLALSGMMNDCLATLMSSPESPNLYWALCEFPARRFVFRQAMTGERGWAFPSVPSLMKLRAGQVLSADEWRSLFEYIWNLLESAPGEGLKRPTAIDSASPEVLQRARELYAKSHGKTVDEVREMEPIIVLGEFYYQQHAELFDDQYKLRGLPYPELLALSRKQAAVNTKVKAEQPGNPFQVFSFEPVIRKFAKVDREFAALTAVEALRSYAAANDGKLPERLANVTETPVPNNPATGKAFQYRVENGVATLSDDEFQPPLTYTIKIRQ